MDGCNRSCEKVTLDDSQAAPLRKASTVKKINGRSLLFCLNKITHCVKKWTTGSGLNELNLNV